MNKYLFCLIVVVLSLFSTLACAPTLRAYPGQSANDVVAESEDEPEAVAQQPVRKVRAVAPAPIPVQKVEQEDSATDNLLAGLRSGSSQPAVRSPAPMMPMGMAAYRPIPIYRGNVFPSGWLAELRNNSTRNLAVAGNGIYLCTARQWAPYLDRSTGQHVLVLPPGQKACLVVPVNEAGWHTIEVYFYTATGFEGFPEKRITGEREFPVFQDQGYIFTVYDRSGSLNV